MTARSPPKLCRVPLDEIGGSNVVTVLLSRAVDELALSFLVVVGLSVRNVEGPAGGIAKCKSRRGVTRAERPNCVALGKLVTEGVISVGE